MPALRRFRAAILFALALTASCADPVNPQLEPEVASVQIVTERRVLEEGETLTLQTRALAADGRVVPGRQATWTSTNANIVSVTPAGEATGVAAGATTLHASIDGKVAIAAMVVTRPSVATVDVGLVALDLAQDAERVLTATPRDSTGRPLARVVTWTSDDPAVATVDAGGRVRGRTLGATVIRAESEGRVATVEVTVREVAVGSIMAGPAPVLIAVGSSIQLQAIVKDTDGNVLTGRVVTWTTDNPGIAMVNGTGLVSGTGHGYATIVASSGGKSFGVAATVVNGEAEEMPFDLVFHRTRDGVLGEIIISPTTEAFTPVKLNAGDVSRQPSPSPSGARIAFYVSMKELGTNRQIDDIFAVDRNGMNMRQLTTEDGYDGDPAWSPDGARIAWRRIDPAGVSSIWVMNADGTGKQKLTADMEGNYSLGAPAWSPDGSRIAFDATTANAFPRITGIWSMTSTGGDKRQHTSTATGYDHGASWSPDGQRIAFSRQFGAEGDIALVNVATGEVSRLQLPGQQWNPAFSPDGRHIAYWQPVGFTGATAIYTVRVDGTNVRLHTTWGGGYEPQWIAR